jgi:hypothetical protein
MQDNGHNARKAHAKFLDHFYMATPTILAKSATTHLPCPLNLEIYGPKQGSILTSHLCHTPFYAIICIMFNDVL